MICKPLVLGLGLSLAGTALAALELPRHAELDLAAARQLADASMAQCTAAVSVLDRGGNLLVAMRGDGVGPHNGPASQRKAYTALSTKTSSRLFAERARNSPEAANLNTLPELLLLGGGLALFAGKQLVGAIGIAGAGGAAQDEACALQAAQRVGLATEAGRE